MNLKRGFLILSLAGLTAAAPALRAQGHFEFSGHYGRWSLNLLGSLAKDTVNDMIKDEIGGGISTAKALDDSSVSYSYTGQLTGSAIPAETVEGSDAKTLRELKNEAETDFPLPNFLPFIQLNLGIKARLAGNIHLFVDGGVLNGLILRGGVALRL